MGIRYLNSAEIKPSVISPSSSPIPMALGRVGFKNLNSIFKNPCFLKAGLTGIRI